MSESRNAIGWFMKIYLHIVEWRFCNFLQAVRFENVYHNLKNYLVFLKIHQLQAKSRIQKRNFSACHPCFYYSFMIWGTHASHMHLGSIGHVISHDKLKTLYRHLHKTYKHQAWQNDDLGWGAPIHQVTCSFSSCGSLVEIKHFMFTSTRPISIKLGDLNDVTWQVRKAVFSLSPNVQPPNFQESRFRMRGSRQPSHITTWLQAHVIDKKSRWKFRFLFYQIWIRGNLKWNTIGSNCLVKV